MRHIIILHRAITAAILTAVLLSAAQTRLNAAEKTIGPVSGTVVDAKGAPAPGAKVWIVFATRNMKSQVIAQTVADQQGCFEFKAIPWERTSASISPPVITAHDAAGRIGTSGMSLRDGTPLPKQCTITLLEGKKYQGRLLDIEGRPIAKASVKPILWQGGDHTSGYYQYLFIPPDAQKEFSVETDAEGQFTISGFPAVGELYADFITADFGSQMVSWKLNKPVIIKLARTGSIQGAVTCAKAADAAGGLPFMLYKRGDPDDSDDADFSFHNIFNVKTKPDGTFEVDRVQPGNYAVLPQFTADLPYCLEKSGNVEVKSGETAKFEASLVPGVKVKGKVVDKETKKGVAGVRLMLYNYSGSRRETKTDAKGEFHLYAKNGQAGLYIIQVPDIYVETNQSNIDNVVISGETTVPTIELDRAINLELIVLDESGKPAANAEVRYLDAESQLEGFEKVLRTDKDGLVSLGRRSPNETVIVRARAGAASDRERLSLKGVEKPVELKLLKKSSFAVAGTLTDESGRPLANANVALHVEFDRSNSLGYYSSPGSFILDRVKTDGVGRFSFDGLWTDAEYVLLVKTPGRERYASAKIKAKDGKSHELGDIALGRTDYAVSGRVVDSAGKPLAAARVFNSGDGPEPMETISDDDGRFRLKGFRKGSVYVFAVKKGYRFAGLKTDAGSTDVELKMPGADEPGLKTSPRSTPLSFDEEKKLARELLEELWEYAAPKTKSPGRKSGLIHGISKLLGSAVSGENREVQKKLVPLMERIDPKTAAEWKKQCGVKTDEDDDDGKEGRSIEQVAETDLDEALSMLRDNPGHALAQLDILCEHFAKSAPEKSLVCAEEAVVRIRALDQPNRSTELGNWSKIVSGLGQEEAGRQLLEEAIGMTDRWKPLERYDDALQHLAVLIAPRDKDRAMRLMEKIKEDSTRQECLAQMIGHMDDPAEAEPLLKKLEPERIRDARLGIAFNLAKKRPVEAVKLLDEILAKDNEDEAEQLARMAGVIGKSAPKITHSLIDRVFAEYLPYEIEKGRGWFGDEAAKLAMLAAEADYPDMQRMILQAFALRPAPDEADSPVDAIQSTLKMADSLAQIDPDAGAELLRSIEPNKHVFQSKSQWFRAWALADPRRAMEMAKEELAALKKGNANHDSFNSLRTMIDLWTTPHERRYYNPLMQAYYGHARMIEEHLIMP